MKITRRQLRQTIKEAIDSMLQEKGGGTAYPGDLGIATGMGDEIDDLVGEDDSGETTDLDAELQVAQAGAESYTGAGSSAAAAKRVANQRTIDMERQKRAQSAGMFAETRVLSGQGLKRIINEELDDLSAGQAALTGGDQSASTTAQFDGKEKLIEYLQGILNKDNRYLKVGARDKDAVTALQNYVIFKLKDDKAVGSKGADGAFGGGTKTGVKKLQAALKINDDGVVGTDTAEVFLKDLGVKPVAREKVTRQRSSRPWNTDEEDTPVGSDGWVIWKTRGKDKNKEYTFWLDGNNLMGADPDGWSDYIKIWGFIKPGDKKPRLNGAMTKEGVKWATKKGEHKDRPGPRYRTWGKVQSIKEFVKRGIVPKALGNLWIAAAGTDSYNKLKQQAEGE